MIQITPQMVIYVAIAPVDFGERNRWPWASCCKTGGGKDPFGGAVFLFGNRSVNSLKVLVYDGQGFWLCIKRLSKGQGLSGGLNEELVALSDFGGS